MNEAPFRIVPNDNEKVREDRNGRLHVNHARTWVLIYDGQFAGEYKLRREALNAVCAIKFPSTAVQP